MSGRSGRLCTSAAGWTLALAAAVGFVAPARASSLDSRVMVLPSEGEAPATLAGLADALTAAVARGARRTTATVAQAAATLADTAAVVGCDPSGRDCLDAVAAALNVDQLLIVRITSVPAGAEVEITAATREAAPVTRRFRVRPATREADLAAIETAVPDMLEAGEARAGLPPEGTGAPSPSGGPPDPIPTGPPVGPPVDPGTGRSDAWRGPAIAVGAGGAVALAGAAFWGLSLATQGDIDAAPTETTADLDRLADLEDTGRRNALIGNVLVVGGAVVIAGGAVWWYRTRRTDVVVVPAVSPDGAGIVMEGRW